MTQTADDVLAGPKATTKNTKRNPAVMVLIVVLSVALGYGIAVGVTHRRASAPSDFTTHGGLVLKSTTDMGMKLPGLPPNVAPVAGAPCSGKSDYQDLTAGAQVKILDGGGKTIALGQLGPGVYTPSPDYPAGDTFVIAGSCAFTFNVPNIPIVGVYGIKIGDSTGPQYTRAQMQAGPHLAVGSF